MPIVDPSPWWRSRVLPLFTFDPAHPEQRPIGLGTTFRIDPFGNAATAFHVIEDLLTLKGEHVEIVASAALVALDMPEGAILLGSPPIPTDWWRALHGLCTQPLGIHSSPLIHESTKIRNLSELALLGFVPLIANAAPYLPLKLRGSMPMKGEILTAYGYANLDVGKFENDAITQYLYSIAGPVSEVIAADFQSSRPWPKVMVEAHWPSGMSGGPVVDAAGEVVGLVSTSYDGVEQSSVHVFSGWNIPELNFPMLDPDKPGWFRGFAAVDANAHPRFFGHVSLEAEEFAALNGYKAMAVSFNPMTGGWLVVDSVLIA